MRMYVFVSKSQLEIYRKCNAHINVKLLRGGGGGGRPGIGRGFELRSVFLFKCPAPGESSWVKKVKIPHTRVIIVGQQNSTND